MLGLCVLSLGHTHHRFSVLFLHVCSYELSERTHYPPLIKLILLNKPTRAGLSEVGIGPADILEYTDTNCIEDFNVLVPVTS